MKNTWKKIRLYHAVLAVCLVFALSLSGCGSGKSSEPSGQKIEKGNTDFAAAGLEESSEAKLIEGHDPYIGGTVVNITDKNMYVRLAFELYDKDGKVVGKAVTEHTDLEPNLPYHYSARCSTNEFDSFELINITTKPAESK